MPRCRSTSTMLIAMRVAQAADGGDDATHRARRWCGRCFRWSAGPRHSVSWGRRRALPLGVGPVLGGGIHRAGRMAGYVLDECPNRPAGSWPFAYRYFPVGSGAGPERPPFDLAGAALLGAAMIAFAMADQPSSAAASSVGVTAGLAAATAVLALVFAVNERRVVEPLTDPRLFGNRFFLGATGTILLSTIGLYAIILVAPLLLKVVQERGSAETGLIMAAISAPVFVFARDRWTAGGPPRPPPTGDGRRSAADWRSGALLLLLDLDTSAWPVIAATPAHGRGAGAADSLIADRPRLRRWRSATRAWRAGCTRWGATSAAWWERPALGGARGDRRRRRTSRSE